MAVTARQIHLTLWLGLVDCGMRLTRNHFLLGLVLSLLLLATAAANPERLFYAAMALVFASLLQAHSLWRGLSLLPFVFASYYYLPDWRGLSLAVVSGTAGIVLFLGGIGDFWFRKK